MSKKRLTALLLAAAMTISAFPASQVWALEENPQSEAEKEAEAEKRTEDKEKDGETEEEEVASIEDAKETIASYSDEEIEWENMGRGVYRQCGGIKSLFQRLLAGYMVPE